MRGFLPSYFGRELPALRSRDKADLDRMVFEMRNEGGEMLFGEDFGGTHVRDLERSRLAIRRSRRSDEISSRCGDCRLSASDIALKKPRHGMRFLEIFHNILNAFLLGVRRWEGE